VERRLTLRREALAELSAEEIRSFAGGDPSIRCPHELTLDTCFSCMTYISCNPVACIFTLRYCETALDCV
jgi:hypothetical protein